MTETLGRRGLLLLFAAATLALVAQLPRLETVFAPESLVPPEPHEASRIAEALAPFTGREEALIVLVEAEDVLAREPLQVLSRLSARFEEERWVARVEGLTTSPFPIWRPAPTEPGDLDALEAEPSEGLDAEGLPGLDARSVALATLLATDPERFPAGLLTFAERNGDSYLASQPLIRASHLERDLPRARRWLFEGSPLWGSLISRDQRLAVLVAIPHPELGAAELETMASRSRRILDETSPVEGVTLHLGGLPEVRHAMVEVLREDQLRVTGLALLGSFVVLLIGFRSLPGVLLPMGAAGMSSGMAIGAMAAFGQPLDLLTNTIPPLLITIGLGDAVHLLVRYREELRGTGDRQRAAARTFRVMSVACLTTSLTTAIGFASLAFSETEVVRRYGLTAALGVVLAFVVTILFVPAALPDFRMEASRRREGTPLDRLVVGLAAFGSRHALPVILVGALVFLGAAFVGAGVEVDSRLLDQLDRESETAALVERLERDLDGVRTLEVVFISPEGDPMVALSESEALATSLRAHEEVLRVSGPTDMLRALWAALLDEPEAFEEPMPEDRLFALAAFAEHEAPASLWAHYVDGRARLEVRLADAGERRLGALFEEVASRGAQSQIVLGGEAYLSSRGLERLVGDLLGSLAVAVGIIFLVLALLLRSVRLGLVSVLPNLVPLAVTLAWMAIRGIPLHVATAIVFAVGLGLAVDGTIHLLARFREELSTLRGSSPARLRRLAVLRSARTAGRAVVIGTGTLLVGFAALTFGAFVPIRLFAELSIVALSTSLVAELVLLPALLSRFGGRFGGARPAGS